MNLSLFVFCPHVFILEDDFVLPRLHLYSLSADNQVLFGAILGSLLQSYRALLFTVVLTLNL